MTNFSDNLPAGFAESIARVLPAEQIAALSDALQAPAVAGIALNPTKPADEALFGFATDGTVPWNPLGRYVATGARPGTDVFYHAGAFYVQEPSAQLPAALLAPRADAVVLDLCAAPGGKTAQLAGACGDGLVVANDPSASRCGALVRNIERLGHTNVIVTCEAPWRLAQHFGRFFDCVLVDAPCSGWGMLSRGGLSKSTPAACAQRQRQILADAARMVVRGGRIVYSTCTLNRTENEDVIEDFLANHADFCIISAYRADLGCSTSMDGACRDAALRVWPHISRGEGFFAAVLECAAAGPPQARAFLPHTAAPAPFLRFWDAAFVGRAPAGRFVMQGRDLFLQTRPIKTDGLRVVRSGWHLGSLWADRFRPGGALAAGVCASDARCAVALDAAAAASFLRGYDIAAPAAAKERDWLLATHHGLPLGFAQIVGPGAKNKRPRGWVIR